MASITADLLRSKFGFNDQNVINGILNDPSQVQRYNREAGFDTAWNAEQSAGKAAADTAALNAKQKAEGDAFFNALQTRVGEQEKLPAMAERISGELGLPALRDSAFNLTKTLKAIPGVQGTIAKQVGISAPRLAMRTASEQGKIAPLAQEATDDQQFAEQELGQRLGYGVAEQEKELKPFYEAGLPLLQQRQINEFTGYSNDKKAELDKYLAELNKGTQLTIAEMNRATQLAELERTTYNSTIKSIGGREVMVTVDSKGNITNKVDLGSSKAPDTNTNTPNAYLPNKTSGNIQSLWGV